MATFTVNDRTALIGAATDGSDQFLVWDASAATHKKISRAEMAAGFMGAGNVATNVAFGIASLAANTTGASNVALGAYALQANTIGISNVGVGEAALAANTTGINNVAIGFHALFASSAGTYNVALGYNALTAATTASFNTALGATALTATTTGANNTAVGTNALATNSTGSGSAAVGVNALQNATTGNNNTAIGQLAGSALTTGSNNTLVGYNAQASGVGVNNEITLGNSSVATLRCQVTTITSLSDMRDKKNPRPFDLGIDFLVSIEPKWFEWNMRPEIGPDGEEVIGKVDITEAGFIAQQLQEAVAAHPGAEMLGLVYDANPDRLEATPGKLTPVFVKALQELHARLSALEAA